MKIYSEVATPVKLALEQVIGILTEASFVGSPKEADLIITSDIKNIAQMYDDKKQFVLLNMSGSNCSPSQSNIHEVRPTNILAELLNIISEMEPAKTVEVEATAAAQAIDGAAWILVIDDKESNRNAAISQLGGNYNVVVADGFDSGRKALKERKFDFVLTDCEMPVSTEGALSGSAITARIGQGIPYGMFLLLEACAAGADTAVVSDLNHHQDAFSAAFDHYSNQLFEINGKKGRLIHARMIDGAKDWQDALDQLMR